MTTFHLRQVTNQVYLSTFYLTQLNFSKADILVIMRIWRSAELERGSTKPPAACGTRNSAFGWSTSRNRKRSDLQGYLLGSVLTLLAGRFACFLTALAPFAFNNFNRPFSSSVESTLI